MSIKLYWGANGSYKSASSVQYDVIPELQKGRVVVTNLRGLTLEKCLEQYPDLPPEAKVINIEMGEAGAMDKMRTWFRWAPLGSLIVMDEIQLIYPRNWSLKELEKFQLDNGDGTKATFEECEQLNQPFDLSDAFTRHRHWNWDIVLTTPNIKYVHAEIRLTTEVAYRQANGALIGVKGRFKRAMHDAQENKPNADSITSTHTIKQKTFKCYQSTTTGQFQDTRAGTSLFKSPKVVLLLAFATLALGYSAFNLFGSNSHSKLVQAAMESDKNPAQASVQSASVLNAPAGNSNADDLRNKQVNNADYLAKDPLAGYDASITFYSTYHEDGNLKKVDFWIEFDYWDREDGYPFTLHAQELQNMGYKFNVLSECTIYLLWKNQSRLISCWKPRPQEKDDLSVGDEFDLASAGTP